MDRNEIFEQLSSDLLWEIILAKAEEVNQIPVMLKNIGYLNDKEDVICQINKCEIFDSEPLNIRGFTMKEDKMLVDFDISFLLSAWHNEKPLLRITATVTGKCLIPDINKIEIVDILELNYVEVECDDLRVVY